MSEKAGRPPSPIWPKVPDEPDWVFLKLVSFTWLTRAKIICLKSPKNVFKPFCTKLATMSYSSSKIESSASTSECLVGFASKIVLVTVSKIALKVFTASILLPLLASKALSKWSLTAYLRLKIWLVTKKVRAFSAIAYARCLKSTAVVESLMSWLRRNDFWFVCFIKSMCRWCSFDLSILY